MNPFSKIKLKNVVGISASSIFFTPQEGETLDFKTVSSTPAAHRGALQSKGLIAKICIGVSIDPTHRREAEELIYGPDGRLKLWRDLLTSNELIDTEGDVIVPSFLSRENWPLLAEEEFNSRVQFYRTRKSSDEVNESPFCAPILSMIEGRHKEHGVFARMCVIWMPKYSSDLISWSECHINSGRFVPEQKLTTIVRHITSGLLTLTTLPSWNTTGSGSTSAERNANEVMRLMTNLEMEDILVNEEDSDLSFVLSVSPFVKPEKLAIISRDQSHQKLQYYPYMAPEQIVQGESPMMIASPKYTIWSLGTMIYCIASAVPSLASQLKRNSKRKGELPFNHPAITPDKIVRRVRRDLEPGGYTSMLGSLITLLLSTDHLTRPSLTTIDQMMPDLNRGMPVLRFPFALGSFDAMHLPDPEKIQLNARARKYISQDTCCVCKKARNCLTCKQREHTPAIASPSWTSDEPLPGIMSSENVNASYLYPLAPPLEDRDMRRQLAHAIPTSSDHTTNTSANVSVNLSLLASETTTAGVMNVNTLFQLFGGFAIYEKHMEEKPNGGGKMVERVDVKDVLVLYPRSGTRKSDSPWTAKQIHFTAALPWMSACTASLQKRGRIMTPVPPIFGGTSANAKWYSWILPGETFVLPNGKEWIPSDDGGFVVWFNDTLEPSDRDRYYALTSLRALTLQARVPRTTLPEKVFRLEAGEDSTLHSVTHADNSRAHPDSKRSSRVVNNSSSVSPARILVEGSRERSVSRIRPASHSSRRPQLRVQGFDKGMDGVQLATTEPQSRGFKERFIEKEVKLSTRDTSLSKQLEDFDTVAGSNSGKPILRQVNINQLAPGDFSSKSEREADVSGGSTARELKISNVSSVSALSAGTPKSSDGNLKNMQIIGCWYPPEFVDVAFEALTFYVPSTGEHGQCQPPIAVTDAMRSVIRAPMEAAYMSFLSNDLPLLFHNHPQTRKHFQERLLLPNHGFAFFARNSTLLNVLALRVATASASPSAEEVRLQFQRHNAVSGSRQRFLANYFEPATPLITGSQLSSRQRHSAPASAIPYRPRTSAPDNALSDDVSGISRLCDADNVSEHAFHLNWDEKNAVCWMGFDAELKALMLAKGVNDPWYPITFCK